VKGTTFDVVIVGGGIMGCSVAYHLLRFEPALRVLVVEKDPSYSRASTSLSVGNVRTQFSLEQNIRISQYALQVIERFAEEMRVDDALPDIRWRPEGNLFLLDASRVPAVAEAFDRQVELGCAIEWWSRDDVETHLPLLRAGQFEAATFGSQDGHLDGHAFLQAYRAKALSLGVGFRHAEVVEVAKLESRVTGVRLACGEMLSSDRVVNCTGAWAAELAATAGVDLPVAPVQRQVFVLATASRLSPPLPLTTLPSGLYFRSENEDHLLVGRSLPTDPVGIGFRWQESRFNEVLWPELVQVAPIFDRLKLVRAWTGLYAVNTLDGNAILGEWPELQGLFLVNGFSGHGLQQAPAVGRYLAELVLGLPPTLDLSVFDARRILTHQPLTETELI
jgi:glycine/D-amino acid oxidase-like deaminating enzyme